MFRRRDVAQDTRLFGRSLVGFKVFRLPRLLGLLLAVLGGGLPLSANLPTFYSTQLSPTTARIQHGILGRTVSCLNPGPADRESEVKSSQVKSMQDFVHQQYVCMYACAEVEEEVEAVAWMEGWMEGGMDGGREINRPSSLAGLQPPHDWRHPCHHRRAQPLCRGHRYQVLPRDTGPEDWGPHPKSFKILSTTSYWARTRTLEHTRNPLRYSLGISISITGAPKKDSIPISLRIRPPPRPPVEDT